MGSAAGGVGLSEEGLARFGAVATSHVGPDRVPGLVALVARGEQVHVEAFGSLAIGGPSVRDDSIFRIASTTKPITAAAAMALIDEGLLHLDDPVTDWLPELAEVRVLREPGGPLHDTVPAERPITVRQLLTFTMGFGMCVDMFMSPEPWPIVTAANEANLATFGPPQPQGSLDLDGWISELGSLPLVFQPGERWLYNTSASVLGVLLARVTGETLDEVLRSRVFGPLGMKDTAMWTADTERLATAYQPTPDGLVEWDAPLGQWSRPPSFADGAGGLVSTAPDLLSFARMFLRGGAPVLSRNSVREMTIDQLTREQLAGTLGFLDGRSWSLGQAVYLDGPQAGAVGWDGGLGTSWLVDPKNDLVVCVLTQRMWERALAPAVHVELRDAAYAALA